MNPKIIRTEFNHIQRRKIVKNKPFQHFPFIFLFSFHPFSFCIGYARITGLLLPVGVEKGKKLPFSNFPEGYR